MSTQLPANDVPIVGCVTGLGVVPSHVSSTLDDLFKTLDRSMLLKKCFQLLFPREVVEHTALRSAREHLCLRSYVDSSTIPRVLRAHDKAERVTAGPHHSE
jgi:hypothetical protein